MSGKFSAGEVKLLIKLRKEGLIGQRLHNEFKKQYPDRSWTSLRSKIEVLREKKVIR